MGDGGGHIPMTKIKSSFNRMPISMGTGGNNVPMVLRERPYYEDGVRKLKLYQYEDTMPTVSTNCGNGDQKNMIKEQSKIRRLTPTECERLQGFPDDYPLPKLADSILYKQIGNSVSVPVLQRFAREIMKVLSS